MVFQHFLSLLIWLFLSLSLSLKAYIFLIKVGDYVIFERVMAVTDFCQTAYAVIFSLLLYLCCENFFLKTANYYKFLLLICNKKWIWSVNHYYTGLCEKCHLIIIGSLIRLFSEIIHILNHGGNLLLVHCFLNKAPLFSHVTVSFSPANIWRCKVVVVAACLA